MTGHVRAFSGPHAFTADPASGPGGLYAGAGRGMRAGWIVLRDGSVRGAMLPTAKPRRCVPVFVRRSDGSSQEVIVCI